jgi:hypothetical protein
MIELMLGIARTGAELFEFAQVQGSGQVSIGRDLALAAVVLTVASLLMSVPFKLIQFVTRSRGLLGILQSPSN